MTHIPVLLDEVVTLLDPKPGDIILDATVNRGGHTKELAKKIGTQGIAIGIDLNTNALAETKENLRDINARIYLEQDNFKNLDRVLAKHNIEKVDCALFDLGYSSQELEEGRGFSFMKDEPLLMTYNPHPTENDLTAKVIVNTLSEEALSNIFFAYGEERKAKKIARAIVEYRETKDIETTGELVKVIESVVKKTSKINPATKVFQGLRIAVNDEYGALKEALEKIWSHTKEGGRIGIITFHSGEDRIVKQFFKEKTKEGGVLITKKPITPQRKEVISNPRARSAKLRVIEYHV